MKIGTIDLKSNVVLAPMAGVTDLPFRTICRMHYSGLMVSEMISVSALYYKDKKTHQLMNFNDFEQPMALQVFTADPFKLEAVMDILNAHNNIILDFNMGCPAPKIVNNGEGSALMKTPKLAEKILKTAVKHSSKPVTVKFRKGWDESSINAVEFAKMAEASGVSAIAIHGRTRSQMYMGKADWEIIRQVKESVQIPVIGNGDVFSIDDAVKMNQVSGCDGIMIGRGVQGNPWLLQEVEQFLLDGVLPEKVSLNKKLETTLKHYALLREYKGDHIATLEIRKHAAWYFKGLQHSNQFKNAINKVKVPDEVIEVLTMAFIESSNSYLKD